MGGYTPTLTCTDACTHIHTHKQTKSLSIPQVVTTTQCYPVNNETKVSYSINNSSTKHTWVRPSHAP